MAPSQEESRGISPGFGGAAPARPGEFHREHARRITWVVAPLMAVEALTAVALFVRRPPEVPFTALAGGAALVLVAWLATGLVSVPLHEALGRGFDGDAHRRLVLTNWVRTAVWSLRGVLVLWFLARAG